MKTIIALQGVGNCGKTTTLSMLADFLKQQGFKEIYKNGGGKDFTAVYTKNGKTLGLTTSGDNYDIVWNELEEMRERNCTLGICACRTKGATITAINSFNVPIVSFIRKRRGKTVVAQNGVNIEDMSCIYDHLMKVL